jgi:predicted nucleic acid-binding protein
MLTLDTSGLVALVSRADPHHDEATAVVDDDSGPYIISAAILAEIAYILEQCAGTPAVTSLVRDLESSAYTLYCGESDFARIVRLMERYEALGLGLADAAVIACAERHRGRVLTFDRRHFPVVARGEGTITVLPQE